MQDEVIAEGQFLVSDIFQEIKACTNVSIY